MIETDYLKGRNPETFLKILKDKGVKWVVDIRDFPAYPIYYRPSSFAAICKTGGMRYSYLKPLGNPKWNRTTNASNPQKQRAEYLRILQEESDRAEALRGLREEIKQKPSGICLVCMCDAQDEMGCHRFWLKKLLESP